MAKRYFIVEKGKITETSKLQEIGAGQKKYEYEDKRHPGLNPEHLVLQNDGKLHDSRISQRDVRH